MAGLLATPLPAGFGRLRGCAGLRAAALAFASGYSDGHADADARRPAELDAQADTVPTADGLSADADAD